MTRDLVGPDGGRQPVLVLSDRHERASVPWHAHRRLQLVHVSAGAVSVLTRQARFVVPPQRAVWIGSGVEHRLGGRTPFWLMTCYIEPDLAPAFCGRGARVVAIDRLTEELLLAASRFGDDYPPAGAEARLVAVLIDRLGGLKDTDIALPEPAEPRLRRITDRLLEDPGCPLGLAGLAADAALTERTAARLFRSETGLTFGQWRQQMRRQAALEHLAAGTSVTQAAFTVGYADVSSFIAAFKLLFGRTPSRILEA